LLSPRGFIMLASVARILSFLQPFDPCRSLSNVVAASDSALVGTVAPCPACGSPITIAAGSPAVAPLAELPHAVTPPIPPGTATAQFRRNPFWYLLHGVDMAAYQAGRVPHTTRRMHRLLLVGLAMIVLGLALLTFLIATIRFGIGLKHMMALLGLGIAFVPLLFGFYYLTAGLLEWQVLIRVSLGLLAAEYSPAPPCGPARPRGSCPRWQSSICADQLRTCTLPASIHRW
jgi:hypothetical protein